MVSIVLDTNILADFLAVYFKEGISSTGNFIEYGRLNRDFTVVLNGILNNNRYNDTLEEGIIIASSFAFIEIARQFDKIAEDRYSIVQLKSFINSPPNWFVISPLDNKLFEPLNNIPRSVTMSDNKIVPIEWADAIHIATALSMSDSCKIAFSDKRIAKIQMIQDRLIDLS